MSNVKIRDIRVILTAPAGIDLVVIKVETTEPGLYGLGCGTFTQRYSLVKYAVEEYLKPLLVGKSVDNIEDIWQLSYSNSYWRNGPVLNNAISGIDEALWDIKGKMAGMPVYQLLGGKCRDGVAVYRHADGSTKEEVVENLREYIEQGYHYLRAQLGMYGGINGKTQGMFSPENLPEGVYFDPAVYMRSTLDLFEYIRHELGNEIEICHDIHERLAPMDAINFIRDAEQYKLFFIEDPFSPEQVEWFKILRMHSCAPIAMGELFNNQNEWKNLISKNLIDFIRVHISQIGGITPAKKLAIFSEAFSVRTAWHGPNDITPVGVAAHLHVDLTSPNFGIQEFAGFTEQEREVFPGCPEVRNGYLYANDNPGLGIDINEKAAEKYPCQFRTHDWLKARLPDGTAVRP